MSQATTPQPDGALIAPDVAPRVAQPAAVTPGMLVQTANALITGAPIGEEQLRAAMPHYEQLAKLLSISGPRFANAMREAVQLHNRAVARLRETRDERHARERRAAEFADGLTDLAIE